jgi:putative glutamine amidotransferase
MRVAGHVEQTPQGEPPQRELALGLAYTRAVEAAGGLPLVIPPMPSAAIPSLVDRLDGLCLSGGPDLDPELYGGGAHPALGPVEPDLDRFELELTRTADAAGLPILGICRGAQLLNVARGGTLVQHLPERTDGRVRHRQTEKADRLTHEVELAPVSLGARTLDRAQLAVNSFHHQAVDRLGRGLLAVAWSPDAVIEAIEAPGRQFLLGVQWHAECLTGRPDHARLFWGLVEAARRHAAMPQGVAA